MLVSGYDVDVGAMHPLYVSIFVGNVLKTWNNCNHRRRIGVGIDRHVHTNRHIWSQNLSNLTTCKC